MRSHGGRARSSLASNLKRGIDAHTLYSSTSLDSCSIRPFAAHTHQVADHQWKRSLIRMREISVIGAITLTPEDRRANFVFDMLGDNANFKGQSVLAFLRLLHDGLNNPITVIWDSVRIHLSKPITDYLFAQSAIVSEPFPPYAPDLNPVDSVWPTSNMGDCPTTRQLT